MKSYIFKLFQDDFTQWTKQHTDCDCLVLNGEITVKEIADFDKALANLKLQQIDISGFSVKEKEENELWQNVSSDVDFDQTPSLMEILLLNKEHTDVFVFENGNVYSPDHRVLVHCSKCESFELPSCFEYNEIEEISIPSSVKKIGSDAFHCNYIEKVILPEGVESIEWNVFTHQNNYIYFPSTMKEIAKDFFYEECIDVPEECVPYIDVDENNPLFFSRNGTLYSRSNPDEPYLGYEYKEYVEEPIPLLVAPSSFEKEYSPDEIKAMFPDYNCKPINSENTLFWIYDFYGTGGYNIIDRYLNRLVNHGNCRDIQFSFDRFVLIKDSSYHTTIFSIDLSTILLEDDDNCTFESCSNDGHIFASVPKSVNLSPSNRLYGVININREVIIPFEYKRLDKFDEKGYAFAQKGSKAGFINMQNNVVIPFDYTYPYRLFDKNDIAIMFKKVKGKEQVVYINRKNECLGCFVDETFHLHEKRFHIYTCNGLMGFARQFGANQSGANYKDINIVDENTIEVSEDGYNYTTIKY